MPKVCYRTCFKFYLCMHFTSGRVLSCFGRSGWNFSFSIMFSGNYQEENCSIADLTIKKKKFTACVDSFIVIKWKRKNLAQIIERCSIRIQLHRSIELMPNRYNSVGWSMGEHTHIHEYLIHNHMCGLNYKQWFFVCFTSSKSPQKSSYCSCCKYCWEIRE